MIQWVTLLNCNSAGNTKKRCLKDLALIGEKEVGADE